MSANAGYDAVFKIGGTPVAGVRVSGFTRDATPIDITDKGSKGYTELLSGKISNASLSMNIEGVEKDNTLRDLALGPEDQWLIANAELALADGDTITGPFFLGNYGEGDDYKEATTFTATLTSGGKWTHTKAGG